jgi:hypothetical protein
MYTRYLLPSKFKMPGWILAIPSFIMMLFVLHADLSFPFFNYAVSGSGKMSFDGGFLFNLQNTNFTDEVFSLLLFTGLIFIAFSKEKDEDEMITRLRLESLLWAVFVNTILIMLAIIFFYNGLFLSVMIYNLATPLILFIARFTIVLYLVRKKLHTESL